MPYRVEYSKSGRAGCSGPCKDGKDKQKIEKGALRFGSWVENDSVHAFWSWRHWGCVTAKQCANLASDVGDDFDNLDGYEDMEDDDKARIRQAIADGEVAEEDVTPGLAEKQAKEEQAKENKRRAKEQARIEKKQAEDQERNKAKKAKEAEKETKKRKTKAEPSDIEDDEVVPMSKKRSRAKEDDGVEATPIAKKRAKVKAERPEDTSVNSSTKSSRRRLKVEAEAEDNTEVSVKTKKKSKAKSDSLRQNNSNIKPKSKAGPSSKNGKKEAAKDVEGSTRSTRRSARNAKG